MSIPDDLITTAEVVEAFVVKLETLYSWVHRGRLRAWKRMGRLYVSRSEVEELYVPVAAPVPIVPERERARERRERWRRTREELARHGMRLNGL